MTPWYTDAEIDDLCAGVSTNAAKVRRLRSMGLTVATKPNGRPLVMRAHAERVLSGMPAVPDESKPLPKSGAQPNRSGLVMQFTGARG